VQWVRRLGSFNTVTDGGKMMELSVAFYMYKRICETPQSESFNHWRRHHKTVFLRWHKCQSICCILIPAGLMIRKVHTLCQWTLLSGDLNIFIYSQQIFTSFISQSLLQRLFYNVTALKENNPPQLHWDVIYCVDVLCKCIKNQLREIQLQQS